MEEKEKIIIKESRKATPAFLIAIGVLLVVFVIYVSKTSLTYEETVWPAIGAGAACAFIGGIVYTIGLGIVESIYKVLVEIMAALLLFANAIYLVESWISFNRIKIDVIRLGILEDWNLEFRTVLYILLPLILANIVAFFIIYPLSRIAGTKLDLD